MQPSRRTFGAVALAIVLAALVAIPVNSSLSPGDSEKGGVAVTEEKVLRMGFMGEIDTLNPLMGFSNASMVFSGLVYDGLHAVGEDLTSTSNLALDWRVASEVSPHGSAWEFNITPNATWHDGEPVTVDDVVFTVNLMAYEDNYTITWSHQPYTYFMEYATKVDSDTVRIHFSNRHTAEPMPVAYADLLPIPILPKHKLEAYNAFHISFVWAGYFEDSTPPVVGTGPFMVTPEVVDEWTAGDMLTLVRNPDYHWGPDKGEYIDFDKVVMYFYDDAVTMKNALVDGHLEVAQFPPETYKSIRQSVEAGILQNVTTYHGLKPDQYWTEIGINMVWYAGPNPSRLDPVIRQAMAMATNKTHIVEHFYHGFAEEASTLISPMNAPWHYELTEEEVYHYDPAAAADLLESGGYTYPYPGAPLRVATTDSFAVQAGLVGDGTALSYDMLVRSEYPEEALIAQYLQEEWAEIGIGIDYEVLDEMTLSTRVYGYAYDLMIWYWSSDPDPNYMLFCQSKRSWYGWSDNLYYNPCYEENYTLSVQELDYNQRKVYVDNCQRINYLDAGYILLAYTYQTYAWRTDNFTGWGDWEANPGRSIDAYWPGNQLYFDLVPIPPPNEPPEPSFTVSPETVLVSAPVTVNASASTDAEDDASVLEVRWDWENDGVWDTEYSSTKTAEHSYAAPGTYTIRLEVNDTDGLTNTTTQQVEVIEDTEAPDVTATLEGTEGTGGWFTSSVEVTLEAEDDLSGVDEVKYRLDGGAWSEYESPVVIGSEGSYTVEFYAIDLVGNEGDAESLAIKIDKTGPYLELSQAQDTVFKGGDVSIWWDSQDPVSDLVKTEISLDGSTFAPLDDFDYFVDDSDPLSTCLNLTGLEEGEHSVVVRVTNGAGLVSTAELNFSVEAEGVGKILGLDWWTWVVVLLAVMAVALMLMTRRRSKPELKEGSPPEAPAEEGSGGG